MIRGHLRDLNVMNTYRFGWDLDTDLLDCFGKFIGLNCTIVVEIKVFECLHEDLLLGLSSLGLLSQFVFQFSLETKARKKRGLVKTDIKVLYAETSPPGLSNECTYLAFKWSIFVGLCYIEILNYFMLLEKCITPRVKCKII